ncbi:MAG: permease-like cell division protein FtsX [Patescibacteria group bacterium]
MLTITIKRIIKNGFVNFYRNSTVSISAIFIMVATLATIISLMLSNVLFNVALEQIKNKVDINVYMTTTATPENVIALKESLELIPEVNKVEYISREQSLVNFRERHRDDSLTIEALEELEENPLGAVLNIKAKEISQYASIAGFLESETALFAGKDNKIIEKVNYYNNKEAIDKLNKIINAVDNFGFVGALILIIISILIIFNTIRLTIFISRQEIKVMRLVGANNNYIRGPFVFEGILYGVVAAIIATLLFYPILFWINPFVENVFFIDLLSYYTSHFFQIFGVIIIVGIFLGTISSVLAVRKYLKI